MVEFIINIRIYSNNRQIIMRQHRSPIKGFFLKASVVIRILVSKHRFIKKNVVIIFYFPKKKPGKSPAF